MELAVASYILAVRNLSGNGKIHAFTGLFLQNKPYFNNGLHALKPFPKIRFLSKKLHKLLIKNI